MAHPSSSAVQQAVEAEVLSRLSARLDVELEQKVPVPLGQATVELDGAAADRSVLVEVFARVGAARGGQLHKISTDTLKLGALREAHPNSRLILAFVSEEAERSIVGWRREILTTWKIETLVIELDDRTRSTILEAQDKQKMINAPFELPAD